MGDEEHVKNKVVKYIQGKHGLIGLIPPDKKTTKEEWDEFYRKMVTMAIDRAKKKEEAE